MRFIQKPLILSSLLLALAGLSQACGNPSLCDAAYRPGPAIVTIDCTEEALATSLPEEPLRVEYTDANGNWHRCIPYPYESTVSPYTQPVCDVDNPTKPKFDCGHSDRLTFEIRATQGERTAGPVEIKTRMKNACEYDEKTLYHELTLDLP